MMTEIRECVETSGLTITSLGENGSKPHDERLRRVFIPRAASCPDHRAADPRHQLVWLHAKQDPRPISPAEAAPERLRKLRDPVRRKKIVRVQKKFPLVHHAIDE